jgi:hypothetical protein
MVQYLLTEMVIAIIKGAKIPKQSAKMASLLTFPPLKFEREMQHTHASINNMPITNFVYRTSPKRNLNMTAV